MRDRKPPTSRPPRVRPRSAPIKPYAAFPHGIRSPLTMYLQPYVGTNGLLQWEAHYKHRSDTTYSSWAAGFTIKNAPEGWELFEVGEPGPIREGWNLEYAHGSSYLGSVPRWSGCVPIAFRPGHIKQVRVCHSTITKQPAYVLEILGRYGMTYSAYLPDSPDLLKYIDGVTEFNAPIVEVGRMGDLYIRTQCKVNRKPEQRNIER